MKKETIGPIIGIITTIIIFLFQNILNTKQEKILFSISFPIIIILGISVWLLIKKLNKIDSIEQENKKTLNKLNEFEDKFKIHERLSKLEGKMEMIKK
jgi:hypothetical protein